MDFFDEQHPAFGLRGFRIALEASSARRWKPPLVHFPTQCGDLSLKFHNPDKGLLVTVTRQYIGYW